MMEKKIDMTLDKETKNYYRFVSKQGEPVTGTIYIDKPTMGVEVRKLISVTVSF